MVYAIFMCNAITEVGSGVASTPCKCYKRGKVKSSAVAAAKGSVGGAELGREEGGSVLSWARRH